MSLFVLNALFDVTHAVLQAAPEVTPASNPDGSPAGSPVSADFCDRTFEPARGCPRR